MSIVGQKVWGEQKLQLSGRLLQISNGKKWMLKISTPMPINFPTIKDFQQKLCISEKILSDKKTTGWLKLKSGAADALPCPATMQRNITIMNVEKETIHYESTL